MFKYHSVAPWTGQLGTKLANKNFDWKHNLMMAFFCKQTSEIEESDDSYPTIFFDKGAESPRFLRKCGDLVSFNPEFWAPWKRVTRMIFH